MELRQLELDNWRNYSHASTTFSAGVNVLVGPNAQGKTNILEAVHYLAVGESHRVASDAPLLRTGTDAAVVRAGVAVGEQGAERDVLVELELRSTGRNRARVDGAPQQRTRDAIGIVRSVLVAPEDLLLVRGDPSDRRRFLDEVLGQRRRAFSAARSEYDRVLKQRNALLRSGRAGGAVESSLDTWTEALVTAASTLLAARIALVHALSGPTAESYSDIVAASPDREARGALTLTYELSTGRQVRGDPDEGIPNPADLASELREGLMAVAAAERERGITLAGPHRDELALALNGMPARGFASHGETWSVALALRLAARDVLAEVGDEPIVLLDDVFPELDAARRDRLAARCKTFQQVLVTSAVAADVPLSGRHFVISSGAISPSDEGSTA